jgi:hypothetical protein
VAMQGELFQRRCLKRAFGWLQSPAIRGRRITALPQLPKRAT